MKYWINDKQKQNQIIIITKDIFYTYSPLEKDLVEIRNELRLEKIPPKISGIVFSRIRKIDFIEGKNNIEIHYDKKDVLMVLIENKNTKDEIKKALESESTPFKNKIITQKSFLEKSSKNLIAAGVFSFITFITYDMAVNMENGWEYEGDGLGMILIGIAKNAGKFGTIGIGLGIIIPIFIHLYFKLKDKSSIERFIYNQ